MDTATRSAPDNITFRRAADFAASTFDPVNLTVDVVWTTGAPVERLDLWAGEAFIETLEVSSRALRLDRLNAGAPALDSHNMFSLGAVVGSVVPGSVRIANGEGTATIRLSSAPDAASTVEKIRAGHIRSISVGYQVHVFERLRGNDGEPDELRAIDWEPVEISFVTVPADPGAHVRSGENKMARIIDGGRRRSAADHHAHNAHSIVNRGSERPAPRPEHADQDEDEGGSRSAPSPRQRNIVTDAVIRARCARSPDLGGAFERDLLAEHRADALSWDELNQRINDQLIESRQRPSIDARDVRGLEGINGFERGGMARAIEDALYARMSGRQPSDHAREFMGASLPDLARGLMEARGERVRWESPARLMQRFGAHTTSDFPNLLQSATGRYLLDLYNDSPSPLRVLTGNPRLVPDFRQITALAILPVGILRPVPENGEFKRVTMNEGLNGYKLTTFGEIFSLTRQAFINDDLGYFTSLVRMWARAATETEATQLAGLITGSGPVLGDNVPLYDPAHGNLAGAGGAITTQSLSTGRQAMRQQKNPDGTPAGVVPRYLVVGPAKETEAEVALAAVAAARTSDVNPFGGKIELIVEPRISGNSWRLFADPSNWPVLERAQLQGQEGLFTDTRIGFDVDGFDFKARMDFGCGAIDHRGTYKNPGE